MIRVSKLSLALLVASAGLAQTVLAANPGTFYLGGAIGSISSDYSTGKCSDDTYDVRYYEYTQTGYVTDCSIKSGDNGFKLLAGYNITPDFAIEGTYNDLGKLTASFNDVYTGFNLGHIEQKTTAVTVDGVVSFPVGNGFAIAGRIGLYSASQDSTDDFDDDKTTKSSSGLHIGASGSYLINKNLSLRLEFERFSDVGTTNVTENFMSYKSPTFQSTISMTSLGLIYNY